MVLGLVVTVGSLAGRRGVGRVVLGVVLVLSCAISHLVIGARIDGLRRTIGPSLDALAPDRFFQLTRRRSVVMKDERQMQIAR